MDEESITSFDISETASRKRSRDDEASAEPAAASRDCIQEGDTVIYLMHDSSQMGSMLKVNPREQQKLGSKKYSVRSLIGRPFGSVFELQQRHLQLVEEYAILDEVPEVALGSADAVGDNSLYHDDNTAQRLKTEDIHLLREQGASGHDIIRSLIQNSDTWGNKSQFAREKWLARKQKRYVRRVRIVKCTPDILADVYHLKSKEKICNLRAETLAQLMSHGGVHAGAKVMIFESCLGLVLGAATFRMGGRGTILAAYGGQQPHFELMDRLNLSEDEINIIKTVHSEEIGPAAQNLLSDGFSLCNPVEYAMTATSDPKDMTRRSLLSYKKSGRADEELSASRKVLRSGLNGMIIATKYDPLAILKEAVLLLFPSSPFVVFCEFMEPLVECYDYLHQNGLAIRMQLCDTWKREFQTLPGRCHPEMRMTTSGGYILSGIYVSCQVRSPSTPAAGNHAEPECEENMIVALK